MKIRLTAFFLAFFWTAVFAWGETIRLKSAPEHGLEVNFNSETGAIESILFQGEKVTAPDASYMPFDLCQGEKDTRNEKWVAWNNCEFLGLEQPNPETVVNRYRVNEWEISEIFTLTSKGMFARKAKIRWNGSEELKIRALWWRFPTFQTNESSFVYVPGHFPPKKHKIAEIERSVSAYDRPGIAQLSEKCTAVFFIHYADPTMDSGNTNFEKKDESGLQVSQVFQIQGRMKPGNEQDLGTTYTWFIPEDGESALSRIHEGLAALGVVIPKDRPQEFPHLLLYSFHPGGSIGSNMQDLGGFQAAIPFVDRIAELELNSVWSLPLEDRGIYWPRDYYKFQEGLGTGDDYRKLVEKFHSRGFYVMQDCVPHGGSNEFERAKQHPEWLVYDEDGSTFHYWCFDFNWPTWREYMKNVAKHYMKNYGVDGYRIDAVSASKIPNWNPDIPYERASFAKLQAGFNMQKSIREGVKEESPMRGGTLAEVANDFFGSVSDAIYDFAGGGNVFQTSRKTSPEEFVSNVRRWLHECRTGSVKDLLRLRYAETHDTVRSQYWYGTEPARAIVALTAFIDGIPLIYQGQEVGNAEIYAKLFAIRKALPEMQNANYDYLGIQAPAGVFAVGYEKDEKRSVGLINFNETPVSFSLSVPETVSNVTEMLSGKSLTVQNSAVPVTLKPFGFTVCALREVSFTPPEFKASVPAEPKETKPLNTLTLSGSNWQAHINATTGLLASMTQNGKEILGEAHLPQVTDTPTYLVESNETKLVFLRKFSNDTVCRLTYRTEKDQLLFSIAWEGQPAPGNAVVFFPCPNAELWNVQTAEGLLRDRLFYRNQRKIDVNSRHSIYWRPLELNVLYDSFYQPLWRNAVLTAECADASVTFYVNEKEIPARTQWLNQCQGVNVLTAAFSLRGPLDAQITDHFTLAIAPGKAPAPVPAEKVGKSSILRPANGGWYFENETYSIHISRFGTIRNFFSKKSGKQLFKEGTLYTDYGFGPKGERYSNENEIETWSRIETLADGSVKLHFEGRPRKWDRFGRIQKTVSFTTEFILGDSPELTIRSKTTAPSVKQAGSAFLSWMFNGETIDEFDYRKDGKSIAVGKPLELKGRAYQTKQNEIKPDELILKSEGKEILCVSAFDGEPMENIFMDKKNFFLAIYDGVVSESTPEVVDSEWKFTIR